MPVCHGVGIAQLLLSPQGRTNKRMALDGKLGACILILPSAVWAAELCTINSHGEQLAYIISYLPNQSGHLPGPLSRHARHPACLVSLFN
jgi:hypothetical protein